jgi:hypothetical protein
MRLTTQSFIPLDITSQLLRCLSPHSRRCLCVPRCPVRVIPRPTASSLLLYHLQHSVHMFLPNCTFSAPHSFVILRHVLVYSTSVTKLQYFSFIFLPTYSSHLSTSLCTLTLYIHTYMYCKYSEKILKILYLSCGLLHT